MIIGRRIKENIICVLNLEAIPKEEAKRILDFLTGYIAAIDGRISRIAGMMNFNLFFSVFIRISFLPLPENPEFLFPDPFTDGFGQNR